MPKKPMSKNTDSSFTFTIKSRYAQISIVVLLIVVAWGYMFDVSLTPSQRFLSLIGREVTPETSESEPTAEELEATVIPKQGYTVNITWGDIGIKLVAAGGIDLDKYKENYSDAKYKELLLYLTDKKDQQITITSDNSYFWINTLWALGLTQKSVVLDEGVMGTEYRDQLGNFASTGGWTLGAKDAVSLYSSADIVPLTQEQQKLVEKVSQGVYRACCGNSTAFPDCNHGMAMLGLIEIMASHGFSEQEIYKAALAVNSYWFPQTYMDLAYYFETKENTVWADVDPKRVLAAEFSSAQGYQDIKSQIGNIPGLPSGGGSCGA